MHQRLKFKPSLKFMFRKLKTKTREMFILRSFICELNEHISFLIQIHVISLLQKGCNVWEINVIEAFVCDLQGKDYWSRLSALADSCSLLMGLARLWYSQHNLPPLPPPLLVLRQSASPALSDMRSHFRRALTALLAYSSRLRPSGKRKRHLNLPLFPLLPLTRLIRRTSPRFLLPLLLFLKVPLPQDGLFEANASVPSCPISLAALIGGVKLSHISDSRCPFHVSPNGRLFDVRSFL